MNAQQTVTDVQVSANFGEKPFQYPTRTQQNDNRLLSLIERASTSPEVDVGKMRELVQMAREERAYSAEIEFNEAMNAAQNELGRIGQDKKNTQTGSMYATYAALDRALRPLYTSHGFSLSFSTEESQTDTVLVVCYCSHKGGHTRKYRVLVPADGKGAKGGDVMTKTHATGSALSYGKRYLLKLIFNIAEGEDPDDDDGNGASGGETAEQKARREADEAKYREWVGKIRECTTLSEYEGQRVDLIAAYGGSANKVPKTLRDFCLEKKTQLSGT